MKGRKIIEGLKRIMGLIGPIGPIGPIRPIGLIRLIGPIRPIGLIRLIGPIGLIALVGCSSGQEALPEQAVQEPGQGPAIGFAASFAGEGSEDAQSRAGSEDAQSRAATRAAGDGELTTDLLKEQGFGVYCWYTGTANFTTPAASQYMLMRNQKVEWGAVSPQPQWSYSPSKYWPLVPTEKLTFRAYAPYVNYNVFETTDPAAPATYVTGMPLLPVVVKGSDYVDGTQHDPLWGTGNPAITHETDPYMPDDKQYGTLYTDVTYAMSGDLDEPDPHDGTIHWFFHHGMAKLLFTCTVTDGPGCDKVIIKGISVENLYDKGLLDISSPAGSQTDKPYWYDRSGDIEAVIDTESLITGTDPLEILTTESSDDPDKLTRQLIDPGLLIIPRTYTAGDKLKVVVTYTIDDETDPQEAIGEIVQDFKGNTVYTLKLKLEPATKGLEITLVQSAFTPWTPGDSGEHVVYNW